MSHHLVIAFACVMTAGGCAGWLLGQWGAPPWLVGVVVAAITLGVAVKAVHEAFG
jgi:hypothetical protein